MYTYLAAPVSGASRRAFTAALLSILLSFCVACVAHASEGSQYGSYGQYGEVTRFGGFDSTWFDEGKYDGKGGGGTEAAPVAGELIDPVGFAVDTDDGGTGKTAVYVLDRVSGIGTHATADGTEWRLQKLSETGAVLGISEFYLPTDEVSGAGYKVFVGVLGLAVDDHTGTVDTILYDSVGSGGETTRQAEEIIDWSTTPNGSGQLVAPAGATDDTVTTPVSGYSAAGVLAGASDLAGTALYEPQGLAVDGADDVALEADAAARSGGKVVGPAIVEQIATATGAESTGWSAASLTSVTNASSEDASALAAGISANPDGSLNVLLSTPEGANDGVLDDVKLSSALTDPTILVSSLLVPQSSIGGTDYPAAPKPDSPDPTQVKYAGGTLSNGGGEASSAQVVQLSNDLFASDYSDNGANEGYWATSANEGIRLVAPETGELLTNPSPPPTSVFDTLGNTSSSAACYLGDGAVKNGTNTLTLAAGANGAIWALTAGKESSAYASGSDAAFTTGRQIIEFAPIAGAKACASPAGAFSLEKEGGTPQVASEPLTVPVGSTVDFTAAPIEYPVSDGGKPAGIYAYEWAPTLGASTEGGYTTVNDSIEGGGASKLAPVPTASHTYESPGVYTVGLKLLGDFGEYDETGTIIVQTTGLPTASFTAPTEAQVGQSVSLDASDSHPATDASIVSYEWKFGDNQSDDTPTASETHTYGKAGTYTVTLTVRDNDNQVSAVATKQITVNNATTTTTSSSSTSTQQSSTTQTTTTTSKVTQTTTTSTAKSTKPLTPAQKLAAALKLCKKDKSKKKRTACESAAKKKYEPKKPAKKKSKAKKKK